MTPSRHIVIAGGGASGLLLATLLERTGAAVTIVEPRERLGAGVAYSTACPVHLLNAPAANMSAVPDDASHFVRWLAAIGVGAAPSDFVPRALYGRYLDSIAGDLRAAAGDRFQHLRSTATECEPRAGGVRITCANGTTIDADAFIVAVGNGDPAAWPRITGPPSHRGDSSPRPGRPARSSPTIRMNSWCCSAPDSPPSTRRSVCARAAIADRS
jgi:uncharacterized NAD(P)/FAD-binding protein YdhS